MLSGCTATLSVPAVHKSHPELGMAHDARAPRLRGAVFWARDRDPAVARPSVSSAIYLVISWACRGPSTIFGLSYRGSLYLPKESRSMKLHYSSKAQSYSVHYFAAPGGTVQP